MKAKIIKVDGKAGKEIELPEMFGKKIRKDIFLKAIEAFKVKKPYGVSEDAGMKYSASGKIRHKRHRWKSHYGRGISRIPRKTMWRRGTQFYWIGATSPSTRGGRRAHPPKPESMVNTLKINKKELKIALISAFSSTSKIENIKSRYKTLKEKKVEIELPIIFDSEIKKLKTKGIKKLIRDILKDVYSVAEQKKTVRAGKGKMRNRRYKKTAGLLFIIGNEEEIKVTGFDVKKVNELTLLDFYPLGRLTVYTEKAIADLEKLNEKVKEKK